MPTPTKIPLAPSVLEKAKVQIPMAWAHFTHQIAENAPEAVDIRFHWPWPADWRGYSKLTAAIAIANWKTLSAHPGERPRGRRRLRIDWQRRWRSFRDYSKLAAAMLVANSSWSPPRRSSCAAGRGLNAEAGGQGCDRSSRRDRSGNGHVAEGGAEAGGRGGDRTACRNCCGAEAQVAGREP